MNFEPKNNNYKKAVEESFQRQQFMTLIGAELIEVSPGYCEIHLSYRDNLTQQHGFFHAGVISTIADNAAGYAAFSLMDENASVLSVEFKINLLSPGDGEKLISKAQVLKNGKTLTICRAEVYILKDGVLKLCAAAQLTMIELKNLPGT